MEVVEIVTKKRGISRYQLAKRLGISLQSLLYAERAAVVPVALRILAEVAEEVGPDAVMEELARYRALRAKTRRSRKKEKEAEGK